MSSSETSPVRVGIAGLGRSGWGLHAETLAKLTDRFKVLAVTDADPARRKEAAERFGCRTYDQFDPLPAERDIELLVVATPSHLHTTQAIQALRAGKHVLCEKPMALDSRAADEMIAAANDAGRTLTVFQTRRYGQDFIQIRKLIDSGRLGRIVQVRIAQGNFGRRWDWQTLKKFGGGTLNNSGTHFIDMGLLLFGDGEPEVFADMQRTITSGDAEDFVKVVLRRNGSPTVDVEMSACNAYPSDFWHIMGTSGSLHGSPWKLDWKWVDLSKLPPRPVEEAPLAPGRAYNYEELKFEEATWETDQSQPANETRFYQDLYATLREEKPLAVDPRSVRRQLAVLEECRRQSPV